MLCRESSCSSLSCGWQVPHVPSVPPGNTGLAQQFWLFSRIMLWRRTSCQETRLFLPPYFLVALDDPRGRGVRQRHYFQNISRGLANLKGSKTVDWAELSQPGLPVCSAPCKYLLCCWKQPWAGSQGGMEKVHTHRTHTALNKLAMSS